MNVKFNWHSKILNYCLADNVSYGCFGCFVWHHCTNIRPIKSCILMLWYKLVARNFTKADVNVVKSNHNATAHISSMVDVVVLFNITAHQTTTPLHTSIYNLINLTTCYEHVARIFTKVDVNVLNWNGFIHKWRAQYCHLWSLQFWHKSSWTNTDDVIHQTDGSGYQNQLKESSCCAINGRYFLIFKIHLVLKTLKLFDCQIYVFLPLIFNRFWYFSF